jgi:hypothetical protein
MTSIRAGTRRDFSVHVGEDLVIYHTVVDAEDVMVNLTDSVTRALVKQSAEDDDVDAVAEFEVTTPTPPTGEVEMRLENIALSPRRYFYDLQIELDDGFNGFPLYGFLDVEYPVTREVV